MGWTPINANGINSSFEVPFSPGALSVGYAPETESQGNMADYNKMPNSQPPANGSGGGHGFSGHPQPGFQPSMPSSEKESGEGLIQVLGRQWPVIVIVTTVMLLAGIGYLLVATRTYTASTKLLVSPMGAKIIGGENGQGSGNASDLTDGMSSEFLSTECDVITSTPVLALALKDIGGTKTLRNVDQPIKYLKTIVSAEVSKKNSTIDVVSATPVRDDAVVILDAVIKAYGTFESQTWKKKVDESLNVLEGGRAQQRDDLLRKQQELIDAARKSGIALSADPDKSPSHLRVVSLTEAQSKAHLETINAQSAYNQAILPLADDAAKIAQVQELAKLPAPTANAGAALTAVQTELTQYQVHTADLLKNYMPNHPLVRQAQGRVEQLTLQSAAAALQWWHASEATEHTLDKSLEESRRAEIEEQASSIQFAQVQRDIDSLKKADDIEHGIKRLEVISKAGSTNIQVLDPAELSPEASPPKKKTLAIALVLGLIAGLGVACVRDWMDDRLRTIDSIRQAVGVPVLGAVPSIITAYTAADRGQIVHHDPFGEAAESYRTLRTALQFGLPKNVKTLLITSAVPGEGKSTLVSNLAIAIAQSNKRVLVIDADFRAPMQHRLFGLKDRVGFSTVLNGNEEIERVIQRTEVEGLDVLPCGPVPINPAEMLNDASFAQHLNDLADRYDLVLLDSPPVTAVTDARIIAASADATVLVLRPDISNRKQAENARDGLRSVGARLIGVAVNGVAQAAKYGGSTGYYSRSDAALAANAGRTAARREMGPLKPVADPGRRS